MTKDTFHVGDLVELLPYDQVDYTYGIFKESWDIMMRQNPLTISSIDGGCIFFEGIHYWVKASALIKWNPCAAPVEDLL